MDDFIQKDLSMRTVLSRGELEALLFDDVPYGDLTTDALGIGAAFGTMQFTARGAMVLALAADAVILTASGPAAALLRGWKVAQTLVEIWSGVASAARVLAGSQG